MDARSNNGIPPTGYIMSAWHTPHICLICLVILNSAPLLGQTDAPKPPDGDNAITLKFPESMEIKLLIDYVCQRLNINIIYDEQVGNKRITLKTPEPVTKESLLDLLESALRMKGLVLVDSNQPGLKQIVQSKDLPVFAKEDEATRKGEAITRHIRLKHADSKQIESTIKPFLTSPGGNTIAIEGQKILIISDYADVQQRIAKIIELADQPHDEAVMEFVKVEHLDAAELSGELLQMLSAKQAYEGSEKAKIKQLQVLDNQRTNKLVLIGSREQVDEGKRMIASLDVPLGFESKVYAFTSTSPDRVDRLVRGLIGEVKTKQHYQSVIDKEANLLIVTATPEIHARIDEITKDLDQPFQGQQSPIRFYKLENATAADVLETIRTIEGDVGLSDVQLGDKSPSSSAGDQTATGTGTLSALRQNMSGSKLLDALSGQSKQARVTADVNTNSIIVIANAEVQRLYAHLIEMLDIRRPQVLIEATLITLDTSDGFSLGVEISRSEENSDGDRVLNFSSFGLSEVDADTGRLTLTPGIGFNGALISADIADIVIKALKTSGKGTILSSPRILVNDNATGTLASVSQAPYTSSSQGGETTQTSFGGFESAGTTINVTPHISEGNHLSLEYSIELSSFSGEGAGGVPPPRQSDTINSQVTVPHGETIVVGGLNRRDLTETIQRVPILGEVPFLEYLFSSRTSNDTETTLFVFIRPVILRDDDFRDLKYYSAQDLETAGMDDGYPESRPVLIR